MLSAAKHLRLLFQTSALAVIRPQCMFSKSDYNLDEVSGLHARSIRSAGSIAKKRLKINQLAAKYRFRGKEFVLG